ncbi:hypothetical protein IE53DRAFT_389233 [Violaceomyces palustris]|uniref:Uncharacterized protein n=1 Tax=Violaceomyces palustris TaxID=1673888 RepID=A0ACD0NRT4_9BASI|nr:hypothetical protein IE53DRAFT_389233 [Violaceomyces palustris]
MSQLYRDPWAKREAWRKHPIFSYRYMVRNMFPGFGIGLGAFLAYCTFEALTHPTNIEKLKEDAKRQTGQH